MHFSGRVPYRDLPAWMYHAQIPPPDRNFNDQVFGITWVDLVFPFFLFTMGAAIPLAIQSRLNKGDTMPQIIRQVLIRGVMLVAFALFGEHFRPYTIDNDGGVPAMYLGLFGIVILGALFWRMPDHWSNRNKFLVRLSGWIVAPLVIAFIHYSNGQVGFYNDRNDIILMVLANVSVSASFIWLFTREKPLLRMLGVAIVAVAFLEQSAPGLSKLIWSFTPLQFFQKDHWPFLFDLDGWKFSRFVPIFYHFEYHKYLIISLPGTVCGDLFLRFQRSKESSPESSPESSSASSSASGFRAPAMISIGLLSLVSVIVACAGLLSREVIPTSISMILIGFVLLYFTSNPKSAMEQAIRGFVVWGFAFVVLGMLAEPQAGGIRKDEATLSYFFLTPGLAFWCIAGITCWVDGLGWRRGTQLVEQTGQNPILGYILITNLDPPVFDLTYAWPWFETLPLNPWWIAFSAFLKTMFVMVVTAYCTRKKIFFRA